MYSQLVSANQRAGESEPNAVHPTVYAEGLFTQARGRGAYH